MPIRLAQGSGKVASIPGRFRLVRNATFLSAVGDGITFGSLPLLVASYSSSPLAVAALDACWVGGWIVFGMASGVAVDRYDRATVMATVNGARAVLAGLFGVAVATGHGSVALVYAAVLAIGSLEPLYDAAAGAIVPELVGGQHLEVANSRLQLAQVAGSTLLGPPIGSTVFLLARYLPSLLDAVTFAVSAALIWRVLTRGTRRRVVEPVDTVDPVDRGVPVVRRSLLVELNEGIRILWGHSGLRGALLAALVVNMSLYAVTSVLVRYVLDDLRLPAYLFGWMSVAFAVGALVGSRFIGRLSRMGPGQLVVAAMLLLAASIGALGLVPRWPMALMAVFVIGAVIMVCGSTLMAFRQRAVPPQFLGRTMATYRVVGQAGIPVAALASGFGAQRWGVSHTYLTVSVLLLGALALLRLGLLRSLSSSPSGPPFSE